MIDDLPTPDDPRKANVPSRILSGDAQGVQSGAALCARWTHRRVPAATRAVHSAMRRSRSSATSALFNTTIGCAPLSQTRIRYRSNPTHVEVAIEARHEKHGVDVGGNHLLLGAPARNLPEELAGPRQNRMNGGGPANKPLPLSAHPVAHRRKVPAAGRPRAAAGPRRVRACPPTRSHDAVDVRVLERHARRLEARGAMGPERLVQPRAPAERL